jgi:hypothetical protein
MVAAFLVVAMLAGCTLAGFGIRSGTLRPIVGHRRAGLVQLTSFVLCQSRNSFNPCVSGRRTYEVWLLVDWKRIGTGATKSYRLVNMALD